ncbi:MAG: HYR domain-containing protein, partial [Thiothrix sp.]|nr:HYR domain-containing protein [Thiothrix sp.]
EASSASDQIEVLPSLVVDCPDNIEVMASGSSCSAVVTFTNPVGTTGCAFSTGSNFDSVGAPALPSDWSTNTDSGTANNWVTTTSQSSSAPNSAHAANHSSVSLSSLTSPQFLLDSNNAKLKFKLFYDTEDGYDGVVLEYSTNNGSTWNDILSGGGTFASGGYNDTLGSGWGNPLPNRQVWSGTSSGFVDVVVNLNASLNGQNISFRWRMGSDSLVSSNGVWLDNVEVEGIFVPAPTTTQIAGLPSGSDFPVGTTTNTFQVEDSDGNTATCSFDVIVNDGINPEIVCPADATVQVPTGTTYTLPDYWADGSVTATDNCSEVTNQTQTPAAGTELSIGVHTIQFTVQDSSGNEVSCSFD